MTPEVDGFKNFGVLVKVQIEGLEQFEDLFLALRAVGDQVLAVRAGFFGGANAVGALK
jgi:hypothetical protein